MSAPPEQPSASPVIRMQGVGVRSLRDESVIVLADVSLEIHAGDFWVLGGLQGSGKTDLLMTMAGLIPPAMGSYHLFGEPMPIFDEARMATRLRLGLVFEGGQLFNHLTVADNISLPIRYHRNLDHAGASDQLWRLMDALDIGAFANSTPGALGRNWRRRVGLARSLALKPEILLVDDPLAGLDLPHASWWLGLLDALSRGHPLMDGRPMTLVVTGADLRPWRNRAKQFAALRGRRLVPVGDWGKVQAESAGNLREIMDHGGE